MMLKKEFYKMARSAGNGAVSGIRYFCVCFAISWAEHATAPLQADKVDPLGNRTKCNKHPDEDALRDTYFHPFTMGGAGTHNKKLKRVAKS